MRRVTLLALAALLALSVAAGAAPPQTLSYQGVLRDDLGSVVPDGPYDITFWIYNVETGGMALWAETQTLQVTDGLFNAVLGSVSPIDLPFDAQYWLAITVEGEAQLTPRTPLTSVPYAYRAAYADVGDDGDWSVIGSDVYRIGGGVGIGTASPDYDVDVSQDANARVGVTIRNTDTGSGSQEGIFFDNEDGGVAGLSVSDDNSVRGPIMSLYNNRPSGYLGFSANGSERMRIDPDGRVGIGVEFPSQLLEVAGTAKVNGFQMPTGASSGYILTSDAIGNATWSPAQEVSDGDWMVSGDDVYRSGGKVGIGTPSPAFDIDIRRDDDEIVALRIKNTDAGSFSREGVLFSDEDGDLAGLSVADNTSYLGGAAMMLYNNRPTGFIQFNTAGLERARIEDNGYVGIGVTTPSQLLDVGGTVKTLGFQMPSGAGTGYVLMSDANGNGFWSSPSAITDGDWLMDVSNMWSNMPGNVGIGTSNPLDKLHVNGFLRLDQGAGNGGAFRFAEGGELKWTLLYRPWVNESLTILEDVVDIASMTFEGGTGDVGIKTTNPETDLHVLGDTKLQGDLEVTGDVTLAPATRYFTVPAAGFVASYPEDTGYAISGGVYTTDSPFVQFVAPVYLPHGATVTSVTHKYIDSSTGYDSSCLLLRRQMSGYSDNVLADVGSTGSAGSGSTTDSTIDYAVVDNTTYAYMVSLTARDGIITYGVVIEYTTTTVN